MMAGGEGLLGLSCPRPSGSLRFAQSHEDSLPANLSNPRELRSTGLLLPSSAISHKKSHREGGFSYDGWG